MSSAAASPLAVAAPAVVELDRVTKRCRDVAVETAVRQNAHGAHGKVE